MNLLERLAVLFFCFVENASNSLLDRNCLEHEWNDGFAAAGIVFEVFLVGAVFAQSPNGHLVEAGEGEQSSCTKENKVNCHLVNNNSRNNKLDK